MMALAANLSRLHRAVEERHMFALVFPNAGFALASLQVSKMMGHPGMLEVAAEVLAIAVVLVWVGIAVPCGVECCRGCCGRRG